MRRHGLIYRPGLRAQSVGRNKRSALRRCQCCGAMRAASRRLLRPTGSAKKGFRPLIRRRYGGRASGEPITEEIIMDVFAGKTAFVTGGASGIGLALGRAFAQEGMNVMLADIEADALSEA